MGGAAQLRAVLYVRVSKVAGRGGDDFHSPDVQREEMRKLCTSGALHEVAVIEDLDRSGRNFNRTGIDQIMSMARAGQVDVVAVYRLNRLGRNTQESLEHIKELKRLGVSVVSTIERIDDSPEGQFMLTQFLAMAQLESDQIGRTWRSIKTRRAEMGLGDGKPRFGYVLSEGEYLPDPVLGPVLADCYQRAVRGESLRSIALRLNAQGYTSVRGAPWRVTTLRNVLRSGFGAGLILSHDKHLPGRHEPVVPLEVWEAFQSQRRAPGTPVARRFLWSGLLRCAYCDGPLHANGLPGYEPGTRWFCSRHVQSRACPGGGVTAWAPAINREVEGWLRYLLDVEEERYATAMRQYSEAVERHRQVEAADITPLERALARSETTLADLARKNLQGFYDDQTYLMLKAEVETEQRTLRKQIIELTPVEPKRRDIRAVADAWGVALPLEQRHMLTLILKHVRVSKKPDLPKYQPVWVDQD